MSTKPADAGRFAVDGSDVDAVNISAPSGTVRNTGFPDDYVPPAAEFNYLENIAYRWRQWLDDGDVEFNDVTVLGSLALSGNITVVGNLDVTGSSVTSTLASRRDTTIGNQAFVFADRTFVSTGSDDLTHIMTTTAHTLKTGDGPFNVTNSGGALPGGLAAATDYWVIRIGVNTFKFATTKANALLGTFISIASNGTGTQTISDTVNTKSVGDLVAGRDIAAEGSVTATGTITGGGDVVVSGTGKLKRGSRVRPLSIYEISAVASPPYQTVRGVSIAAADNIVSFLIPVEQFETITQLQARVRCGAASSVALQVIRTDISGTGATSSAQLGSTATSAGTSSLVETLTVSGLTEVVGSGFVIYSAFFTAAGANARVEAAWVTTTI